MTYSWQAAGADEALHGVIYPRGISQKICILAGRFPNSSVLITRRLVLALTQSRPHGLLAFQYAVTVILASPFQKR